MSVAQRRKSKPGMASILQWEVSSTQVSASIETITILIIRTANRCPMPGSCSTLSFLAFWLSSISESFAMRLKKHFALRGRGGGGRCESVGPRSSPIPEEMDSPLQPCPLCRAARQSGRSPRIAFGSLQAGRCKGVEAPSTGRAGSRAVEESRVRPWPYAPIRRNSMRWMIYISPIHPPLMIALTEESGALHIPCVAASDHRCPRCDKFYSFSREHTSTCSHCGHEITPENSKDEAHRIAPNPKSLRLTRWLDREERTACEEKPIGLILCAGQKRETVELLDLESSGIRVASYWTEAVPKKRMEQKLHEAVRLARERLAAGETAAPRQAAQGTGVKGPSVRRWQSR